MLRVIIESPYGSEDPEIIRRNVMYLERCLLDSLRRGEAPFASHAIYPQVLDDQKPGERRLGIEAGFTWNVFAELCAIYMDYGITKGMSEGIVRAERLLIPLEYRRIGRNVELLSNEDKTRWEKEIGNGCR